MGLLVQGRCWATAADVQSAISAMYPMETNTQLSATSWAVISYNPRAFSIDMGTGAVTYTRSIRRDNSLGDGTPNSVVSVVMPVCTGGETWPGTVASGGGGGTVGVEELQFTASVLVGGFLFLAFVLGIMAGWRRGVAG